jgi:hypothetical protein
MKNETNKSVCNIEEVIKEYDELVLKYKGIDPSWKDEEVNALMSRISELEKEYDQTVISFEMEIFQGYTCMGCAVVNDLEVEEAFSLEELSKMRYLVSRLDEEQYSEGIMPVLRDGAPELYERMVSKVRSAIFDFFVEDGISQGFIDFDEDELRRNFLKDYGLDDKDFDEDLYYEWYDEEMERIRCSGLRWIRSRYSVDDHVSMEDLPDYTVDIPTAFLP